MQKGSEIKQFLKVQDFGSGIFEGNNPKIDKLLKRNRFKVSAWRHACPKRNKVAQDYGLDWTQHRYDECDFVWGLILEHAKCKPELLQQLISSVKRLPGEPMGKHERGAVPKSHKTEMSPLSTSYGYALPRVFIEQAGRNGKRTWDRYSKAIDLLDKAIQKADSPIDLLARYTSLITKADAKRSSVLGHIFENGILGEENCRVMFNATAEKIKLRAPKVWKTYENKTRAERRKSSVIEKFPIAV